MAEEEREEREVRLEEMLLYALQVPAARGRTLEGGEPRYECCHYTAAQGHGETCTVYTRARHIEAALERSGIAFARVTSEAQKVSWLARLKPPQEGDVQWLAEFLNHASGFDPHDDEAHLVDLVAPFAFLIRAALEGRDRKLSMEL